MIEGSKLIKLVTRMSMAIGVLLINAFIFSLLAEFICNSLFQVDMNKLIHLIDFKNTTKPEQNALNCFQGIVSLGTFFVSSVILAFIFKEKPLEYLGFSSPLKKIYWVFVPLLLLFSIPFLTWLVEINGQFKFPNALSNIEQYFKELELKSEKIYAVMLQMPENGDLFINIIVMALIPALGEELFCRGVLLNIIFDYSGKFLKSVFIVGLIFTFLHLQFFKIIPMLSMAVILGLWINWTGGIWASILFHFLNNSLAVVGSYFSQRGYNNYFTNEQASNPIWYVIISFIASIALILYLNKYSRNQNQLVLNE